MSLMDELIPRFGMLQHCDCEGRVTAKSILTIEVGDSEHNRSGLLSGAILTSVSRYPPSLDIAAN